MTDTNETHHEDCGLVGDTGEHGDLGTNAAGVKELPLPTPPVVNQASTEVKIAGLKAKLIEVGYDEATAGKMAITAVENAERTK